MQLTHQIQDKLSLIQYNHAQLEDEKWGSNL